MKTRREVTLDLEQFCLLQDGKDVRVGKDLIVRLSTTTAECIRRSPRIPSQRTVEAMYEASRNEGTE